MTGIDRRLRDLLEAATGEPPHQVSAEAVRRRVSRRRAREYLAGAAAVAVIAVLAPLGIGAAGHAPGPAGRHRSSAGPTVYVSYEVSRGISGGTPAVIPISTATNRAGEAIELRDNSSRSQIVISPDGKTAYVVMGPHEVVPVSTATNTADQPIQLRSACRSRLLALAELRMAFTPDGKTLYVACEGAVVPVSTATNTPGRPVRLSLGYPFAIAIKP